MNAMLSKLKKILGGSDPNHPGPTLREGEDVVLQGVAARTGGLFGRRWGPLVLTNRRLLWYETANVVWPLKRISGELNLSDVAGVDKGSLLDVFLGGRRLRLKLLSGKSECLYEGDNRLDEWIATIRRVIGEGNAA